MQLMPDERHEQLIKAAEECIDLMNIGAEPSSALRHVKTAFELNDKEVTLVSHAVNNSKQLAHLQSSDAKDKAAPFPLTNAEDVTGAASDADLDTPVDKAEQPDAVEIAKKIKKDAMAQTWASEGSFRSSRSFDKAAAVSSLKEVWGDTPSNTPITYLGNPYDVTSQLKIAAEEARTTAVARRDEACACLDKLAAAFLRTDAPSFIEFEKAASASGVTAELIDFVYDMGPSDVGVKRTNEKHAGDRLYVHPRVHDLLKIALQADELWQQSANYEAARTHLLSQIAEEEQKIAGEFGLKDIADPVSKSGDFVGSFLPSMDPESISKITNVEPEKKDVDIHYKTQQQLHNSKARSRIQSLMQDDYIGKQGLPDVVESYNRAMSVNPEFGDAEIMAFIRQDIASKSAMPLDLMVRASQAHRQVSNKE